MMICMEEMKLIGRRIKTSRMSRGVSQLELAEAIGMSQTNLSNVESGRTASTIQVLLKMEVS
jgi:transcriptional regulator with XRE-family HTH domain